MVFYQSAREVGLVAQLEQVREIGKRFWGWLLFLWPTLSAVGCLRPNYGLIRWGRWLRSCRQSFLLLLL